MATRRTKSKRIKMPNGAGSITQRSDGRWMARYTAVDPATEQKKRSTLYGKSEAEARALLIEALSARQNGSLLHRKGREQTLTTYATGWLARKSGELRPKTHHRYAELMDHVLPTLGKVKLTALTASQIKALMNAKHKEGLSAQTVNHVRSVLRTCLGDAMRDRLITHNPASAAGSLKLTDSREVGWLNVEQARTLLALAESHQDGPAWIVAVTTGLRQSELLGLRWSDVKLEAPASLTVNRTMQKNPDDHTWIVQPPKTAKSRRTVPLTADAVEALLRLKAEQARQRLLVGKKWAPEHPDLIFTTSNGEPIDGTTLTKRFRQAADAAGLPAAVTFHGLRHSYASILRAQGIDARTAMALLGHSVIATTMNVYSHVGEDHQRIAADAVEAAFRR